MIAAMVACLDGKEALFADSETKGENWKATNGRGSK